jgi:hypothetical protein
MPSDEVAGTSTGRLRGYFAAGNTNVGFTPSLGGDGGSRAVTIRRLESYFLEFRSLSTLDCRDMGICLWDRCFVIVATMERIPIRCMC